MNKQLNDNDDPEEVLHKLNHFGKDHIEIFYKMNN